MKTRFCLISAAMMFGGSGSIHADAGPPAITLPSHVVSTPPAALPVLVGTWNDEPCLLLPPGITLFETITDRLTFRADGTFAQTIDKATGRLQTRGTYMVAGSRLTLSFPLGLLKPAQYEFSRTGDRLLLQPVGLGKSAGRTLMRVGTGS